MALRVLFLLLFGFGLGSLCCATVGVAPAQADKLRRAGRALRGDDGKDSDKDEEDKKKSKKVKKRTLRRGIVPYQAPPARFDRSTSQPPAATQRNNWGPYGPYFNPWQFPPILLPMDPAGAYRYYVYYAAPGVPYVDSYTKRFSPEAPNMSAIFGIYGGGRSRDLLSGVIDAQVDFKVPLGFRAQYRRLLERLPEGNEQVGIAELELLWRIAEGPSIQVHSGFGYVQWSDAIGSIHGVRFSLSAELQPFKPFTIGSRLAIGPMDETELFQWRTHVGVMLGPVETLVAYDHLVVSGIPLGGLLAGFRLHL